MITTSIFPGAFAICFKFFEKEEADAYFLRRTIASF